MSSRFAMTLALVCSLVSFSNRETQAYEPAFTFGYGYAVGQMQQFRNRLPAPPYFAVYPPVYYGERHERPYGESPFASWPLLTASQTFQTKAANPPVTHANPYVPCVEGAPSAEAPTEKTGNRVTVINPFVEQREAVVSLKSEHSFESTTESYRQ